MVLTQNAVDNQRTVKDKHPCLKIEICYSKHPHEANKWDLQQSYVAQQAVVDREAAVMIEWRDTQVTTAVVSEPFIHIC